MKQNICITLQYIGTRYNGWQKQGNTDNTIQGKLEAILTKMTGAAIEVHGSGRTDAGVHALGQTASFHLDSEKTPAEIMAYLNAYLPQDIGVIDARGADPRFHARLSAKEKTYRYRIHTGGVPDVFGQRCAWQHPAPLDAAAMARAAQALLGEQDFKSFCDLKKGNKSTLRCVHRAEVRQEGADVVIELTGNGFLYHMVRLIVGTLTQVGERKRLPGQLPDILAARDRQAAGVLAPAQGLTLVSVGY